MEQTDTCTVCESSFCGNFCSQCGQKNKGSITTIGSMLKDVVSHVFTLEKSVFGALILLIRSPQQLIENYWLGYRKYYPSPGKLLFYALTTAALQITFINSNLLGLLLDVSVDDSTIAPQLLFWTLFFPIILLSSITTFIRNKIPFTKHLISLLYLCSGFFILYTILYVLTIWYNPDPSFTISAPLFLISAFAWNAVVFTKKGKQYRLRVVLNTLMEIVMFALISSALVGLVFLTNPKVMTY